MPTTTYSPPIIYEPAPDSEITVERHHTVTFRWRSRGTAYRSIVINVGTTEGNWDIIHNAPVGNAPQVTLDAGLLPTGKQIFVQLIAEIDGDEKDKDGNTVSEYIASETFPFRCAKRTPPEPPN